MPWNLIPIMAAQELLLHLDCLSFLFLVSPGEMLLPPSPGDGDGHLPDSSGILHRDNVETTSVGTRPPVGVGIGSLLVTPEINGDIV